MISQRRLPIFEKPFYFTGNYTDTTTGTNNDQNPEEIFNSVEYSSRMIVDTTYSRDETFVRDTTLPRNQVVPYFVANVSKDALTQASAIWTQSSIGENGLHYYHPAVLWSDVNYTASPFHVLSSTETNIPGIPSFLLKVHPEELSSCALISQQALTDVTTTSDDNSQHENNASPWNNLSNTTSRPFCNSTSNRLHHYSLPFSYEVPCQQNNFFPDLSSELTSPLTHFGVPNSNQSSNLKEGSNIISSAFFDPHSTLTTTNNSYSEPSRIQVSGDVPNQILPNFYQLNYVPQSFFNQNLPENQANSQMYNEIQPQTSSNVYNDSDNQRQISDTCLSGQPLTILNVHPIPIKPKQEIAERQCSYTCITLENKPHQPSCNQSNDNNNNNAVSPRKTSSCLLEDNIETFVPKFYEKMNVGEREETPSCLVKEASLSEQVNARVDEFMSSPIKKRRSTGKTRKFSCPICGRKLARASTLNIHMRQHSGDRPYKCPSCPKAFAQPSLLQSHRRTHTGERPYSCSICHKRFAYCSALKTHTRTHTGEKPHKCPVPNCELAFADSSTLSKHARVHSGERPYPCDICGKRFTQSGNMTKHRRTIHKANGFAMEKMSLLQNTMILSELLRNNDVANI